MSRVVFALVVFAGVANAQVNPARKWRTIRSEHFYVHFTPELEPAARRVAAHAESAYVKLSVYLRPPKGMIDVVVGDNVDYTNGSATPFPSNRIVIYANPPVDDDALRFMDDPTELIVTHELVHIFHLDRSSGIWAVLRSIVGREPFVLPHVWEPSWLIEGLAVYFESAMTGSGRLEGTNHRMIARTAAANRTFPRIDELSLASPTFPYGAHAYVYGSLFMEHLAQTRGDSSLGRFVEVGSKLLPLWLNLPARFAFKTTFTREYSRWRDSLQRVPSPSSPAIAGFRDLTTHGAFANEPRWLDDSTIVYDGTDGKASYGAYRLRLRESHGDSTLPALDSQLGTVVRTRLGRRETQSANVRLADGSLLFSKLEFISPYDQRSDLYVQSRRGRTRRLTRGARLSHPDARADGLIVAMQTVPAGTRLTLVAKDGKRITPITDGSLDVQWTEPRWSPDGQRIVAVRWTRGGTGEVVVIDTTGRVEQSIIRERAVASNPSWSWDGRFVYFTSDRTGISNLYRASVGASDSLAVVRVSDTQTGLFEPQLSPNGRQLLAVAYRADGFHIGVAQSDSLRPVPLESIAAVAPRDAAPVVTNDAPAKKYSPFRSLLPGHREFYFEPALDSNAVRLGLYVDGSDVVNRHAYAALLYVPTDNSGLTGAFSYRNARFGQPVFDLSTSQERSNLACVSGGSTSPGVCAGFLRRRVREASAAATFSRVRVRSFAYFSVGGGVEVRDYSTDPDSLLSRVDSIYQHVLYWPRATVSFGWNNAQRPRLSISPEDGMAFAVTSRLRYRGESPPIPVPVGPDTADDGATALSAIVSTSMYKSVPLPGFAHHVLALRAAGGWVDSRNPSYLEVGGVSGGTLEVLPGYNLGEGRRTFGVRGFPAGAMIGMRAFAVNAEYRAPLAPLGRGYGLWPAFLERTSVTLFGDLGSAWCPALFPTRRPPAYSLCSQGDYDIGRTTFVSSHPAIYMAAYSVGSIGAELTASAAVIAWDTPLTYRLGWARPVIGTDLLAGVSRATAYLAVGLSF